MDTHISSTDTTHSPDSSMPGSSLAENARETAESAWYETRLAAMDRLTREKGRLGTRIADTASATRDAAGSFRNGDRLVADGLEELADLLQSAADYIDERTLEDVGDDAASFVRRHPALTLGAAAVVGVLAGRVLRAGFAESGRSTADPAASSTGTPSGTPTGTSAGRV